MYYFHDCLKNEKKCLKRQKLTVTHSFSGSTEKLTGRFNNNLSSSFYKKGFPHLMGGSKGV